MMMADKDRNNQNVNQPSPFDVLNSAFAEQDEEIKNRAEVERMRKIYDMQQTKKAAATAVAAEKAEKAGQEEDDEASGGSCLGWFFKGLLVLFLAAVLAWIIFMPSGSLKELWSYIEGQIATVSHGLTHSEQATDAGTASTLPTTNVVNDDRTPATTEAQPTEIASVTEAVTTTAATTAAAVTTAKKTQTATTTAAQAESDTDEQEDIVDEASRHIVVYLKSQLAVVYEPSGEIAKAFICSTGKASTPTRTGNYKIRAKYRWRLMIGNCYTQYASSFSSGYLLHSIPYNKRNAGTMSNASYDKLGNPASSGCVRLCFRDSKWIYDNCPIGTSVRVTDDFAPVGVEGEAIPSRIDDAAHSGWDPTDDAPESPYNN